MSAADEKNPNALSRQLAVALDYDAVEDSAPRVIARGKGHVARKILEIAEKHRIPVKQDDVLAQALSKVNLGDYIPEELFPVVAEVLAYIFAMNRKYKR